MTVADSSHAGGVVGIAGMGEGARGNESQMTRVLIVDDDECARQDVSSILSREGFRIAHAFGTFTAQGGVRSFRPDLVLLEWASPSISGLEFMRWMERYDPLGHTPVILLTTRAEEDDRVLGLESGAADCIAKPFSELELLARIKAVLRRTSRKRIQEVVGSSCLTVDLQTKKVSVCGREVTLGSRAFWLLAFLVAYPERVHSRDQLLECVWGHRARCEIRRVDVEIGRLRRVLQVAHCGLYIQTVHGCGYRFSTRQ